MCLTVYMCIIMGKDFLPKNVLTYCWCVSFSCFQKKNSSSECSTMHIQRSFHHYYSESHFIKKKNYNTMETQRLKRKKKMSVKLTCRLFFITFLPLCRSLALRNASSIFLGIQTSDLYVYKKWIWFFIFFVTIVIL